MDRISFRGRLTSFFMSRKPSIVTQKMSLLFLLGMLCFSSYSQIDSVEVSLTFTTEVDSVLMDSAGNAPMIDVLNVNTTIEGIDFMGAVVVTVYQEEFPLARIKTSAQEFIDFGLKNGSTG